MRRFLLLLFITSFSISAHAQKLFIDAANSSIEFEFRSKDIKGTIAGLQTWTADLNLYNLDSSYVSGSVAVETIKTKNFFRDKLWQGRKYFAKKEFPRIHFTSTSIVQDGDVFVVTGKLKVKDQVRTISMELRRQDEEIWGVTSVNLQDFGVALFKKRIDNRVNIKIRLRIYNPASLGNN